MFDFPVMDSQVQRGVIMVDEVLDKLIYIGFDRFFNRNYVGLGEKVINI